MKKNFKSPAELFISEAQKDPGKEAPEAVEIPKGYILAKENKSERLQLLIRPTLKQGIKKAAELEGVSANNLINDIIEEYLRRKGI